MPIDRGTITQLIKDSETKKVDSWKKDYFEKLARMLQVHTKGQLFSKVDTLFPNEHPTSKAHVLATYEPITKASIWKGINNLLRILGTSSFTFQAGEEVTKWLEEYEYNGNNLLNHFLNEWVTHAVAEDPNGLFVVYPPDYAAEVGMCPIQWVRSEFIKSRTSEYVSFISERDSEVNYSVQQEATKREVFYDDSIGRPNARTCTTTTYNERVKVKVVKEVVHVFTKEGFLIYKKEGNKNEASYETTIVDFADPQNQIPVFPGGGIIADQADTLIYESFVQPFVPFGNLALLQHRNHRAVDLSFSYPRMMEIQTACDHAGCVSGQVKCPKSEQYPDGKMPCPSCKGSGWTIVQSPYKVYNPRYDPNDTNDNKHLSVDPVKFFSPDVAIINYSKDSWKEYLDIAETSIFVTQKVYTGMVQSEESKKLDLDDMFAWLLGVSKMFYNNLRLMLQSLEEYMSRNPTNVSVERPFSFAVLTEGEAFLTLNSILTSNAPVFIKGNQVDNFVSRFVSRDNPVTRALDILKQYDSLLFYTVADVQTFKGANVIDQSQYKKHVFAYPILLKLYMTDKNFLFQTDEQIIAAIDKEIEAMGVPEDPETFRRAVISSLQPESTE